jgi:hypothetical protein
MFNCFKKKTSPIYKLSPIENIRWVKTDIYNKDEKDPKLVKTQSVLQYQRTDGSWEDVWTSYNSPIYLENK